MSFKSGKISFEFDPFEMTGIAPIKDAGLKRRALEDAADFVKQEVLQYVAESKSPVSGGSWKRSLSKEYRKLKTDEGGTSVSDMQLTGDMLDALDVAIKRGGKLSLEITGREAAKADGHNNHSGDSKLPERKFIPEERETFKRDIVQGLKSLLKEYVREDE